MKKIAILTFHRACNYGAFLQGYALQEYMGQIEDLSAYMLDYYSEEVYDVYKFSALFKRKGSKLKNIIFAIILWNTTCKRNKAFSIFRENYYKILHNKVSKNELADVVRDYDAVVVGSDQVWNTDLIGLDATFFLNFVPKEIKKYSYAASVGKSKLSAEELKRLRKYLEDFQEISFREPQFVEMFKSIFAQKNIICSMDPVFLHTADYWRGFAKTQKRLPYVLYFTLGSGQEVMSTYHFACELAKEKGIKPLYLSSDDRWYKFREMEHFGVANPAEFVGLIDAAEYVVTNSFHATAFAIILHKPFFVDVNTARNDRIFNLLEITGLLDRGISCGKVARELGPINWKEVDMRLQKNIEESKKYLQAIAKQLD